MSQPAEPQHMTTYQFQVDDETWAAWKETVPRSKSLEQRIIELIEADTEGRVVDAGGRRDRRDEQLESGERWEESDGTSHDLRACHEGESGVRIDSGFDGVEFPSTKDRDECVAAVEAAVAYLEARGSATMREIVRDVMPEHSLGYDIPELEEGDRYRGSWWRRIVKPGLEAVESVEKPTGAASEWRYVGE